MKEYLKYFISIIIGMIMACFLYDKFDNDLVIVSLI
jgi:hypothetical protein